MYYYTTACATTKNKFPIEKIDLAFKRKILLSASQKFFLFEC